MRTHAISENRRVLEKNRDRESKEIGPSRDFPPREPPKSMPSVKARSSTRVFVPKNISKVSQDGSTARVLRSGKRFAPSNPFGKTATDDGDTHECSIVDRQDLNWWKGEGGSVEDHKDKFREEKISWLASEETKMETSERVLNEDEDLSSPREKSFGIIYSRKRRRPKSFSITPSKEIKDGSTLLPDGSIPLSTESGEGDSKGSRYGIFFVRKHRRKRVRLPTPSRTHQKLARYFMISDDSPWIGTESRIILVILSNPRVRANSHRLNRLVLSLLTEFTKRSVSLFDCAAFLSSGAVARVFSSHGINFLPVRNWVNDFSLRSAVGDMGACILFGAHELIPLVSLDFSFLPLFFTSLHLSLFLSSLRVSSTLVTSEVEVSFEERRLLFLNAREEEYWSKEVIFFKGLKLQDSSVNETGSLGRSIRPKKRQKRSISSRRSFDRYRRKSSTIGQNGIVRMDPEENLLGLPVQQKKRKTANKNSELHKLPANEQSGGFSCCTANVLVINSDRCWREKDAKITLEFSNSNKWCLSVQSGTAMRYIHKTHEVKLSSTNRYTHAMIWGGEMGWKLEFCDKKEWYIFKELHKECFERNSQVIPVKLIPIPVVREVPGYEEHCSSSFNRPESYVRTMDEVERAMRREKPCYDMDSGDEEWVEKLNTRSLSNDSEILEVLTDDAFENIVSAFERVAYCHPESSSDPEKVSELCPNFGSRDVVMAVFEYWMKKRKQRRSSLVRAFQEQPQKKTQQTQKSSLRKKRSFKRQGSRVERRNYYLYIEDVTEEDIRKAQEDEARARRAVDYAIRLRTRAQLLMVNAERLTLKSMIAVRIAEAASSAEPLADDSSSSIFA